MRLLILLILVPLFSSGQDFEKREDIYLKEKYIRYYDRNAGLLIQKIIKDSLKTEYELTLMLSSRNLETTDFLSRSSVIVFEDKSYIVIAEQIFVTYFQDGKHQYRVTHTLNSSELAQLKHKKIERIIVSEKKNTLDKWQKDLFQKACQAIEFQ